MYHNTRRKKQQLEQTPTMSTILGLSPGTGLMTKIITITIAVIITVQSFGTTADGYEEDQKITSPRLRMRLKGCDLFKGRWVHDDSYPLYEPSRNCPFIGGGFDCVKNGRADLDYLKYRWKPNSCELPRFDGRDFLERLRDKKLMFVGDSLSSNQWESLTCMLHTSVPNSPYIIQHKRGLSTFTFHEYNASVVFLKNGFLVDVITVDHIGRVLKLDSISSTLLWLTADVIVFNSFHWWTHRWEYYQVGRKVIKGMNHLEAYEIGMTTWANWVDTHIDTSKTRVFFQGVSASHINGSRWGEPRARSCERQTTPVEGSEYPGGEEPGEVVLKRVLRKMNKKVYLLDVTLLTQLRKDGHPSYYYHEGGSRPLDCSHWCLAGVPDTWNELLYTTLFYQ